MYRLNEGRLRGSEQRNEGWRDDMEGKKRTGDGGRKREKKRREKGERRVR